MSDVQPSDAAVEATALALHDIDYPAYPWRGPEFPGWADHFEPYLTRARAALAAGLAVEYAALADRMALIPRRFGTPEWDKPAHVGQAVGYDMGLAVATEFVRAAAGGTP